MQLGAQLYAGKAKILYATSDPNVLLAYYKDDATAFNAQKRGTIANKGEVNCAIATNLFKYLESKGIATHLIEQVTTDRQTIKAVKILPLEVVVRNIAAGSLVKRTGLELGTKLNQAIVEFYYKKDELGDPLFTDAHIALLELATPEQLQQLRKLGLEVNQHLQAFFNQCDLTLVDFKLEFGLDQQGNILLADEISPDTCRLWDQRTDNPSDRVLDKDRFRQDLGNVAAAYQEVMTRIQAAFAN
ncbi:phosphoribosylaminoimidazolesuccinocarboxamide synthase [Thalassoporum mexicanum]|uniref:phosphoribosylaminoimidazolesuccinocarboxamide synthase n=1 Tax=Thalassoporum mexicanum TaxID=3457544 RepID=UPI00059FC9B6